MLSWAVTFLVIALIAAVLGFGVIAGTAVFDCEDPVPPVPDPVRGLAGSRPHPAPIA